MWNGRGTGQRCSFVQVAAMLFGLTVLGAASVHAQPAGVEAEVVMASPGGTFEQFNRNEIIPAFEKATGIKIKLVIGTVLSNYAKVVAARNNPDIDVYWSNELTHTSGKQQGLYEKLDPKVVTNLADVYDFAKDPDGIGVNAYVLATGIQYNSKALREAGIPAPTSWNDLWDPRLKGKVALYSFDLGYSQDLLVLLARAAGGSEKNIRPGLEKLKTLRTSGNLAMFVSSPAELDNMLVQGTAWMTVNGSARAFILKDRGAPIDFAFPKEGAGYFTNYFEVVKNAPNPKAAQLLVNFLIGSEMQLVIAKGVVAAPINKKVAIPDSLRGKAPLGEAELKKLIRIDRVEMNRQFDSWAEMWNREIDTKR